MNNIFLCIEDRLGGKFQCAKFDSYLQADDFHSNNKFENRRSTMIPIFKYMPCFFQKMMLNYHLSKVMLRSEIVDKDSIIINE